MVFEGILKEIVNKAKQGNKTIILPESNDERVLKAANIIQSEKIANIILIGNRNEILNKYNEINIEIEDGIVIINPSEYPKIEEYANKLYELRKHKGMTLDMAKDVVLDYVYFANMMVYFEDADGLVSGAIHSTADTLRPALQIIKSKPGINTVSSFFVMETKNKDLGSNGTFVFSDCGLVEEPTEDELKDIANSSVESFRKIVGDVPKVAFLSYSTFGSAKGEKITKIQNVVNDLKQSNVNYDLDGEMQLDAAIIKEVAKLKAPQSKVAGNANILIFPNLEAGNIGYKLAQRFGNMLALGPVTQGLNKPVNDLSRGCNVEDIVGTVAVTCVQAME